MWITKNVITIACDHAGFALKEKIKLHLIENGFKIMDFGTHNEESCDYPDYAHQVGKYIQNNADCFGIVLCGSANGVNMVVNKYPKVRSALCWKPEIASLARKHNNANVLAVPARFIDEKEAIEVVNVFLSTDFEGGRHQGRIDKIALK